MAARAWTLFAEETSKLGGGSEPIDFGRLLSIAAPCFGKTIWQHLLITLIEGILAFAIGALVGALIGFWLARYLLLSAVLDPDIKMLNALPRVVPAPIFPLWLGLGIWSKAALGVSLVLCIVFFNVDQGVKEVSPVVLANARMLGMGERQLLCHVYWPSALSWIVRRFCHHRRRRRRIFGIGGRSRLLDPAGRRNVRHDRGICGYGDLGCLRLADRLVRDADRTSAAGVAPDAATLFRGSRR